MENENKSISDIAITISPVYVTPKTPKLKKGEAIDYPAPRYSTLDHEMIAKLNAGKKQIQQRFNPPASLIFNNDDAPNGGPPNGRPSNDRPPNDRPPNDRPPNGRPPNGRPPNGRPNSGSSSSISSPSLPGPISFAMYEYGPPYSPEFLEDKTTSKPMTSVQKYPPMPMDDQVPDNYKSPPNNYQVASGGPEMEYPNFDVVPSYENTDEPTKKPMKFANHHDRPFQFDDDSYGHDQHHDFHHEMIYDHLPDHYHEHHVEHTTEQEPEMNDQRLDKRPYSYYFIGKKLWYVPLYFSIYFIIYIAALVLKSIARHKINFPANLAEAAGHSKRSEPDEGWWHFAGRILEGVERFAKMSGDKDS
ncbi:PREDICTED: early nodulin-75 [Dinoponera quadriceps]|uniref:Early nodulin-75 n=1 Tax=Dinoponera quadriceps TaxID=609295 RepID=A0A6P3YDS1_DINQU|nr:PREDICTED: early nodulin-75 [Dinoponera quadriceps]